MTNPTNPPEPPNEAANPLGVAALGLQFAVALIAFGYLGQWIDLKLNTAPIFLMVGVFFGGGGTFYLNYRRLTAMRPPK